GADLVAEYLAPFATVIARRSVADAEVVAACRSGHITDDLRDSDFGVDFPECGNLWRQPQRADGGGGANGHVGGIRPITQLTDGIRYCLKAALQRDQQECPLFRQLDPAMAAQEQRAAQILLKRLDLMADRGRGHVHLLCSGLEAKVAGCRLKTDQR